MDNFPLAYLITFSCYGSWLHGHSESSVDKDDNIPGTPLLKPNEFLESYECRLMKYPPYYLDPQRRIIVLNAITNNCQMHDRILFALHVRMTHVHAVIQSAEKPERIVISIKASASHELNLSGLDTSNIKRWTKHASTKYLWRNENVERAIHYVLYEQGEPMSIYPSECLR